MSYLEDGGFFSPICKHFIELETIRDKRWVQCPCGKWFNYGLMVDLESARARLEVAHDDVRFIEAEVARVSENGAAAGVKRFIKAVANSFRSQDSAAPAAPSNIRVVAPAVVAANAAPAAAVSAPAVPRQSETQSEAYVPPALKPAAPKLPERPRGIAASENRRQVGLFITAVTMVMVAYISYISWGASQNPPIDPGIQVPISIAVIFGLGYTASRAKKFSRVLANVLAITSSVLALVALWALAHYNVWGAKAEWVDGATWHSYAYVALIPFILGVLTIVPGYFFKVAAWLNPTAVLFAASGVIFNLSYQQQVLVGDNPSLSLGWQLLTPTITMALVLIAGKLSRQELDELPDEKGVQKLIGAPEADRRAYYELVQAHTERTNLNRVNRLSLVGLLSVMAIHIVTNLINFAAGKAFDGVGLLVLGLVWIALGVAIEAVGTKFTTRDEVPLAIRRGAWLTGIGSLGLGIVTASIGAAGEFSAANFALAIVVWLVGAALLFAAKLLPWAKNNSAIEFASNISAFFIWVVWFGYALYNGGFADASAYAIGSVYAALIAATLMVQNLWLKSASLQIPAALMVAVSALFSLGAARTSDGQTSITGGAVALTLALLVLHAFTVLNAAINRRAEQSDNEITRIIGIASQIAVVAMVTPRALTRVSETDASQFWPLLAILVLFATALLVIPSLSFATKKDSLLTPKTAFTLTGTAAMYLGMGFIYLVNLSSLDNIFATVTGYTFAVMLLVLTYGYIRRAVWAITTSYALSTVFSIGLGEAMMVYQNVGREGQGDATIWAVWFLVPFAILTYLHLLIMRVRAEAGVTFKVALGFGGFALTSVAYELTRANIQNQFLGASQPAEFATNQFVNTATLLGLGGLVLLLRLVKAVRADEARNQVLNLSGLMALALALVDAGTSVASTSTASAFDSLIARVALLAVAALLLINSRTIWANAQVIAAFFVGQALLYNVEPWILNNWFVGASTASAQVLLPYVAFFAALGWFALSLKLGSKAKLIGLLNTLPLAVSGVIALVAIGASQIDASAATLALTAPGVALALLFVWRWLAKKSTSHLGVMTAGVIVWVAGLSRASALSTDGPHYWLYAVLLVTPAVLLLLDALITRLELSAMIALTPLLVSSWLFAASLFSEAHLHFAFWNLVLPVVAFAIATLVMKGLKALDGNSLWFTTIAPIGFFAAILEGQAATNLSDGTGASNVVDWSANLVVALAVLLLIKRIGGRINAATKNAIFVGAWSIWVTGISLIALTADHYIPSVNQTMTSDISRNIEALIYIAVSTVAIYWYARAAKSKLSLLLGTVGSGLTATLVHGLVHSWYFNWQTGPEIAAVVAAGGLAYSARSYRRVVGEFKGTLISWGVPTLALMLPSVLYSYSSGEISLPWNLLSTEGVIRLIGLALIGTLVMLIGMRAGNKGLVYASVATLMFEFVPALWFGIGNLVGAENQQLAGEFRGLLIAVTIYIVQTILRRVVHININSIVVWGIPAIVTLAPTLIDVWGALGHANSSDWVRFAVLVTVSTGFMIIGAIRRLSGLFYPGFIGVIAAVLPYAFGQGGLGIVFTLIALAGLIIWVAVRIDRFSGWLKELK